jgi:hypothetical protein
MICFIIKVFSSTNAFLLEINLQDLLTRNIAEILLKLALKTNKSINLFLISYVRLKVILFPPLSGTKMKVPSP